ncbi:MAG: glutaminyl-peptide cyclotransferase [Alphaproteobacteria bacterium]|nr:glutaminyl-peptide cyclotransferase [Alphaproteobacteria bacterium]
MLRFSALLCAFLSLSLISVANAQTRPSVVQPEFIATYPHDEAAFTQGLSISEGLLLESTGQYGQSTLRRVELETGEVIQSVDLPAEIFGEGSVRLGDEIFVLSWMSQRGFIYDAASFELIDEFSYPGQGWGLTADGQHLIMSDGSHELRFLDPQSLTLERTLEVNIQGRPVRLLNELEWIDGSIWANIWQSDTIVRINPQNGEIDLILDLRSAVPEALRGSRDAVLNGIAYDADTGRIFITGKLWPVLHEIRLPQSAE